MANKVIDDLIDEITEVEGVVDSAVVYIEGVPALIKAAVDAAISNGATAEELAPVSALGAELKAKGAALKSAIEANAPTP